MAPVTILLIPGAFTTPACFDHLAPHLESAGHEVVRASLVSTTPADPSSCSAELQGLDLLNNHIRPLVEAGKDVLVFAHSIGATTCCGLGSGLTQSERRKVGKVGGIVGIVWNTCALAKEGTSQLELLGGSWPPFCKLDCVGCARYYRGRVVNPQLIIALQPAPGLLLFDDPVNLLYNDVVPSMQVQLAQSHIPTAISVFTTPVKELLWAEPALEGRRLYILTLQDNLFPAAGQRAFIEGSGVEWDVTEIDAGHEAIISNPEIVAKLILEAARKW